MLKRAPEERPGAAELQTNKYFDSLLMSTLKFLETLCEKTQAYYFFYANGGQAQKSQFMKGLNKILPQFPLRVLKSKVRAERVLITAGRLLCACWMNAKISSWHR